MYMQLSIRDDENQIRHSRPIKQADLKAELTTLRVEMAKDDVAMIPVFKTPNGVRYNLTLDEGITGYVTAHIITEEAYNEQVASLDAENDSWDAYLASKRPQMSDKEFEDLKPEIHRHMAIISDKCKEELGQPIDAGQLDALLFVILVTIDGDASWKWLVEKYTTYHFSEA